MNARRATEVPLATLALASLTLALLSLAPRPARADGMAFPAIEATSYTVEATEQQAILWKRGDDWEIHIQPTFQRDAVATAWVVPFPVRPDVSLSDALLFEHLNLFTSPLFLRYCHEPSCWCGEGWGDAMETGASGTVRDDALDIDVWETGELGALDYAIVSAGVGDDLASFLAAEGYHVPDTLEDAISDMKTEGVFFFLARLSDRVAPGVAVEPIRFVLPFLEQPLYPLRLTRLGVAGDDTLDLTLFVVYDAPEGDDATGWRVDSHDWQLISPPAPDQASWAAEVDRLFEEDTEGRFLVEFGRPIGDALSWLVATGNEVRAWEVYEELGWEHWGLLESLFWEYDSGLDVPNPRHDDWSEDLQEMADSGAWVFRLHAKLPASAMTRDLTLSRVEEGAAGTPLHQAAAMDPLFVEYEGSCYLCDPCPELDATPDAGTIYPTSPDAGIAYPSRTDVVDPANPNADTSAAAPATDGGLAATGGSGCQSASSAPPLNALLILLLALALAAAVRRNRRQGCELSMESRASRF